MNPVRRPWVLRGDHWTGAHFTTTYARGAVAVAEAKKLAYCGWDASVTHRPTGKVDYFASQRQEVPE